MLGDVSRFWVSLAILHIAAILTGAQTTEEPSDRVKQCPTGAEALADDSGRPLRCLPHHTDLCLSALGAKQQQSPDVCCYNNRVDYYCCIGISRSECPDYSNVTVVIFREQKAQFSPNLPPVQFGPSRAVLGDQYQSVKGLPPGPQTRFGPQIPAAQAPNFSPEEVARAPFNPPPGRPGLQPVFAPLLELTAPGPEIMDAANNGAQTAPRAPATGATPKLQPKLTVTSEQFTAPDVSGLATDTRPPAPVVQAPATALERPPQFNEPLAGQVAAPAASSPAQQGPPGAQISAPGTTVQKTPGRVRLRTRPTNELRNPAPVIFQQNMGEPNREDLPEEPREPQSAFHPRQQVQLSTQRRDAVQKDAVLDVGEYPELIAPPMDGFGDTSFSLMAPSNPQPPAAPLPPGQFINMAPSSQFSEPIHIYDSFAVQTALPVGDVSTAEKTPPQMSKYQQDQLAPVMVAQNSMHIAPSQTSSWRRHTNTVGSGIQNAQSSGQAGQASTGQNAFDYPRATYNMAEGINLNLGVPQMGNVKPTQYVERHDGGRRTK